MDIFEIVKIIASLFSKNLEWWQAILIFIAVSGVVYLFRVKFQRRSCGDCIKIIIPELMKMVQKIQETKYRAFERQMQAVEHRLGELSSKMVSVYYGYSEGDLTDTQTKDLSRYRNYMVMMELSEYKIKSEFRRSIRENGLVAFTGEEEYQRYVKNKMESLLEIVHQQIQGYQPEIVLAKEKEIYADSKLNRLIYGIIYDIINECRKVDRDSDAKVKKAQSDFDAFLKEETQNGFKKHKKKYRIQIESESK